MANIKISELNELSKVDRTDIVPIVDVSANETKKVLVDNLIEKNVELLAISDTAPSVFEDGDKYYNTSTKKIYTAIDGSWSETGETPLDGLFYIVFNEQSSYAWNGTDLVSVGGGKEDIVISDTEPTDPDVKLWIDTGEVQNLGSEITISETEPLLKTKVWLQHFNNLFVNYNKLANVNIQSNGSITTDNDYDIYYIPCNPSTTYVLRYNSNSTSNIVVSSFENQPALNSSGNTRVVATSETIYTTRANDHYLAIRDNKNQDNINAGILIIKASDFGKDKMYVVNHGVYDEFTPQNEVYSTTEQRIGTWIDGKPLYRRVLESDYLTTGEYTLLGNSNSLDVVMIYGWILKPNVGYILPYGSFMNTEGSYTCRAFFDGTNVKVQQNTNYQDGIFKARVVIEYTKKTD